MSARNEGTRFKKKKNRNLPLKVNWIGNILQLLKKGAFVDSKSNVRCTYVAYYLPFHQKLEDLSVRAEK